MEEFIKKFKIDELLITKVGAWNVSFEDAEYVGSYYSQFGVKAFWPKEWFSDYIIKDFEGIKVRVPIGYDKLLTQVYGDYMKLPPKEKRVSGHHVAYLNLDRRVEVKEVLSLLNK